jgi:hypothetical protein
MVPIGRERNDLIIDEVVIRHTEAIAVDVQTAK